MMRIGLFLLTNMAVVLVIGVLMSLLGLNQPTYGGGSTLMPLLVSCFAFGMVGSLISLFASKWMATVSAGVQIIEQPQNDVEAWLMQTVAELAQQANIGMPDVGIFPNAQANAFATGWNKNQALVAVSTGILEIMSQDELKAVLGHEIGHVANGDMVTLALIQGVLNTFVMFFARIISTFLDRTVFRNDGGPGIAYYASSFVLDLILGIGATLIVSWFSRRREYRADHAGAQLAGRESMIGALLRLEPQTAHPDQMPQSLKVFAISEGREHRQTIAALFRSHPPIQERVQRLQTENV